MPWDITLLKTYFYSHELLPQVYCNSSPESIAIISFAHFFCEKGFTSAWTSTDYHSCANKEELFIHTLMTVTVHLKLN